MRHLLLRYRHRSQRDLNVIHSNLATVAIFEADLEASCGVLSDQGSIFKWCIPRPLNDPACLKKSPDVKKVTVSALIIDQVDAEAGILFWYTLSIRLG